ncbi:MAG: hypothetical protein [Caudoviricetes sp.]|nr:MAG: hypothetical protein [Caudoviricetes sp.]
MSRRYSLTTTVSCEWGNCQNKSVTTLNTDKPELIRPGYLPEGWVEVDGEIRCPKHWMYLPGTNIQESVPRKDTNEYKN